jgi:hypothetical protein
MLKKLLAGSALLVTMALIAFLDASHVMAQAPTAPPRMVFAHYMPCFPPRGINPESGYWYGTQFDPRYDDHRARPILYTSSLTAPDPELQAYVDEINMAKSYGLDGFLVDELEDSPGYRACWQHLLRAAEIVGNFKIGVTPDYATLNNPDGGDIKNQSRQQKIKHWLDIAGNSPALLRLDNKPCVIPYGVGHPDGKSVIGEKAMVDWFAQSGMPIAYMATHGLDWPLYKQPYANDPQTGFQTFAFGTGSFCPGADTGLRQRALDYWPKSFMQMGENSFLYMNPGPNWYINAHGSTVYRDIWQWNITHRDRYRWVQVITWNDWGESGIAPSVNHFMAWQPVTKYYTDWFKTGTAPRITKDIVFVYHRAQPVKAAPTRYPKRTIKTDATDDVEALAFLTAPATLILQTGETVYRQEVPAGVQSLLKPVELGVQSARIERNGKVIASATSPVPCHNNPARQNLWTIGATSAYPLRSIKLDNWSALSGTWTGAGDQRNGTGASLVGVGAQMGNYRVSAQVTPSLDDNTYAGVITRAQKNSYYLLAIGTWNHATEWRVLRVFDGVETVLESGKLALPAKTPRTIRLDNAGAYLVAFVDDKLLTVLSDWGPDTKVYHDPRYTYGQAGVSAGGAEMTFTQVRVESFDPQL